MTGSSSERHLYAREAQGLIEVARALAHYELEPSAAAAYQAKAYGKAVEAYTAALSATVKYLEDVKAGRVSRTWEKDVQISDMWRTAQDALSHFDNDLAMRCFVKSQGWLDPTVWDSPEFKSIGVSIQDMRLALKEFYDRSARAPASNDTAEPDPAARWIAKLKRSPIVATIVVVTLVVGGFAAFTDNVNKIWSFFGLDKPRFSVSAGGPVFLNPTLNSKGVDACILTPKAQTSENIDPDACSDAAQLEVANQFCQLAHYAHAVKSTTDAVGAVPAGTYKLARVFGADGHVQYAWNEDQRTWLVFSSITCDGK